MYNDFKPLNYKKVITKYFLKKNINYNKLMLSIDSIYSITKPELSINICKKIQKNMPNIEYIIDGTSNVGTTAIVFSYYFKYIYAIEINDNTYKCLKNNINVYNINNIKAILDDITIFMKNKLKEINGYDINKYCLFLDPPWGGTNYKLKKNINLKLSNIDILDFLQEINIKYIIIKVPLNYNFLKLNNYFPNISIYKLNNFYIIFIIKD